eukprot:712501-Prorocentrum_minimum.AAC.1
MCIRDSLRRWGGGRAFCLPLPMGPEHVAFHVGHHLHELFELDGSRAVGVHRAEHLLYHLHGTARPGSISARWADSGGVERWWHLSR